MAGPRKSNADDIISSILLHNEEKQITTYLAEPRFTNSLSRLSNGSGYINHFDEDGYLTCLSEVYSIYCERKQNRKYDAEPIMFIINAAHEIDDFKNNKKCPYISI